MTCYGLPPISAEGAGFSETEMRFRLDELGTELKEIVPRMHFCVGGREIPEDKGGIDSNKYCLPVT